MKTTIYLLIAAMLLTAALAVPGAAQNQIPLNGTIQGEEIHTGTPPLITANCSCAGIGTLVGQLSFNYQLTINLGKGTATGTAQLIAANGDSIFTTVMGSSDLVSTPGFAVITEVDTITGGTGRFVGAQGSFSVVRTVSLATGVTSGSFHGTITSPGAAH